MSEKEGLSGLKETGKGFLTANPIKDQTLNGRARIKFLIGCGDNKPDQGKFPIWRYCVGYDDIAIELSRAIKGSYIKVSGWLSNDPVLNADKTPVLIDDRQQFRETLILYSAELLAVDSLSRQLAFLSG